MTQPTDIIPKQLMLGMDKFLIHVYHGAGGIQKSNIDHKDSNSMQLVHL